MRQKTGPNVDYGKYKIQNWRFCHFVPGRGLADLKHREDREDYDKGKNPWVSRCKTTDPGITAGCENRGDREDHDGINKNKKTQQQSGRKDW